MASSNWLTKPPTVRRHGRCVVHRRHSAFLQNHYGTPMNLPSHYCLTYREYLLSGRPPGVLNDLIMLENAFVSGPMPWPEFPAHGGARLRG